MEELQSFCQRNRLTIAHPYLLKKCWGPMGRSWNTGGISLNYKLHLSLSEIELSAIPPHINDKSITLIKNKVNDKRTYRQIDVRADGVRYV